MQEFYNKGKEKKYRNKPSGQISTVLTMKSRASIYQMKEMNGSIVPFFCGGTPLLSLSIIVHNNI